MHTRATIKQSFAGVVTTCTGGLQHQHTITAALDYVLLASGDYTTAILASQFMGIPSMGNAAVPLRFICALLLAAPASSWMTAQHRLTRATVFRRAATPLLKTVDVSNLPARPPMTPGNVVGPNDEADVEVGEEELMPEDLTPEQVKAKQKALMDAAVIGDAKSKITMDRLKNDEDNDGGLSEALGKFFLLLDPTGTVRRRLWTRADFMHIHAVSGGYSLFLGVPWLLYSHVLDRVKKYTPRGGRAELGKHPGPCARSVPQPRA